MQAEVKKHGWQVISPCVIYVMKSPITLSPALTDSQMLLINICMVSTTNTSACSITENNVEINFCGISVPQHRATPSIFAGMCWRRLHKVLVNDKVNVFILSSVSIASLHAC